MVLARTRLSSVAALLELAPDCRSVVDAHDDDVARVRIVHREAKAGDLVEHDVDLAAADSACHSRLHTGSDLARNLSRLTTSWAKILTDDESVEVVSSDLA